MQELRAVLGHQIREGLTFPMGFGIYYIRATGNGWDRHFFPTSVAYAKEAGIYQMWENNFPEGLIDFRLNLVDTPETYGTFPQCNGRRIATINSEGTIFWKENTFSPPDCKEAEKWLTILSRPTL